MLHGENKITSRYLNYILLSLLSLTVFILNYRFTLYNSMFYGRVTEDFIILSSLVWKAGIDPKFVPSFGYDGSYFQTHFSPIFSIFSLLSYIQPLERIEYFACFQSLGSTLLAASFFQFLNKYYSNHSIKQTFLFFLLSYLLASNGIYQMVIYLYHFEHYIPTLIFLFLSCWIQGKYKSSCIILILLFSVREDAGCHLIAPLGLYIVFEIWKSKGKINVYTKQLIIISIISFIASLLSLYVKSLYPGDDAFSRIYFDGSFEHLANGELKRRITSFLTNRLYITIPITIYIYWYIRARDIRIIIPVLAYLPWLSLGFIAKTHVCTDDYYNFPLSVIFFWPVIYKLLNGKSSSPHKHHLIQQPSVMIFQTVILLSAFSLNGKFKTNFAYLKPFDITNVKNFQRELLNKYDQLQNIKGTRSTVALAPFKFTPDETLLSYEQSEMKPEQKDGRNQNISLLYYAGDFAANSYISDNKQLRYFYKITDTHIRIATYDEKVFINIFSNLQEAEKPVLEQMYIWKNNTLTSEGIELKTLRKKSLKKGFFALEPGNYQLHASIHTANHNGNLYVDIINLANNKVYYHESFDNTQHISLPFNIPKENNKLRSAISIKVYPRNGSVLLKDFNIQKVD